MGSLPFETMVDTQNSEKTPKEVDSFVPQTRGHPHRIHGTIVDLPTNLP